MKMWVVASSATVKTYLTGRRCNGCKLSLLASSYKSRATQYSRGHCCNEDPWISAGDHPTHIVYGVYLGSQFLNSFQNHCLGQL